MAPATTAVGETTAQAPDEAVWAVLADPCSYPRWVVGTRAMRRFDAAWPRAGSRLYHRFGPFGLPDRSTVLASEPCRRLVLEARARPWGVVVAELVLTPVERGTRIRFCEEVRGGLLRRLPWVAKIAQRWRIRRSLALLARLAEGRC